MSHHGDGEAGSAAGDARLNELDAILNDLTAAAGSPAPLVEFADRLLASALHASRAEGAALWSTDAAGAWRPLRSRGLTDSAETTRTDAVRQAHDAAVARIAKASPRFSSVLAPAGGRVLELLVPAADAEREGRLLIEIAQSLAEIARGRFDRHELDALRRQVRWLGQLEAFGLAVHRRPEIGSTAFAIANDGKSVLGCRRLTVTDERGRAIAVSGVESHERRSDAVRRIERLAAAAIDAGGRFWTLRAADVTGDPERSSGHLAEEWEDYRRAVPASGVHIALLETEQPPQSRQILGALIAEEFGDPEPLIGDRLRAVAGHTEQALAAAIQATPGPLESLIRKASRPFGRTAAPRTALVAIAAAAVIALLLFVRTDFTVSARGRLMPERTRDVFAPSDGVVRELEASHGSAVTRDQVLMTLTDPALDLEQERVVGELATTRQRLAAVQAERATGTDARAAARPGQLASDENELAEMVASLERQREILRRQRDALSVRSPIDGVVLTWDPDERLASRPVRKGQRLLTVVDPGADWLLELSVPDRESGHLLDAKDAVDAPLDVRYILATDPATVRHAKLDEVALSSEPDDGGQPSLRVTSRLARGAIPDPRPGATVVANIACGHRPIGYVLFHEFYEAFLTHVWF